MGVVCGSLARPDAAELASSGARTVPEGYPSTVSRSDASDDENSGPERSSASLQRLAANRKAAAAAAAGGTFKLSAADASKFMLHLRVMEGKELPSADSNGYSDPFLRAYLSDAPKKHVESPRIERTLHPVWVFDHSFVVDSSSGSAWDRDLVIDVYDWDKVGGNDFLGKVCIPLDRLRDMPSSAAHGWFDLMDKKLEKRTAGQVLISVALDRYRGQMGDQALRKHRRSLASFYLSHADNTGRAIAGFGGAGAGAGAGSGADESSDDEAINRSSTLLRSDTSVIQRHGSKRAISVVAGTWNCGNAAPPEDLSAWLPLGADVFLIGSQECSYKGDANKKTGWDATLAKHFGRDYELVACHSLGQMRLAIVVSKKFLPLFGNVQLHSEATGVGHVMGNKGGVVVSMSLSDTSLCVVNSHLAAHQDKTLRRNKDYREIVRNVKIGNAGSAGVDFLHQFHHVIWMGDLNYRLDFGDQGLAETPSREQFDKMVGMIERGEMKELFEHDQLVAERTAGRAFVGFEEGRYTSFAPTFKVERVPGKTVYVPKRSPAWTDRVLWKSMDSFEPLRLESLYSAPELGSSDHKPVAAVFSLQTQVLAPATDDRLGECVLILTDMRVTDTRLPTMPKLRSAAAAANGGGADDSDLDSESDGSRPSSGQLSDSDTGGGSGSGQNTPKASKRPSLKIKTGGGGGGGVSGNKLSVVFFSPLVASGQSGNGGNSSATGSRRASPMPSPRGIGPKFPPSPLPSGSQESSVNDPAGQATPPTGSGGVRVVLGGISRHLRLTANNRDRLACSFLNVVVNGRACGALSLADFVPAETEAERSMSGLLGRLEGERVFFRCQLGRKGIHQGMLTGYAQLVWSEMTF